MGKISVVIHTFNNESVIRECLESVKEFDEIVLCDMHSSDRTLEIAKEYDCKIVMHEKIGFVEPARNFAIQQATNDWVLVVDSDEIITKDLREYLYKFLENPKNVAGVRIPRLNYAWGKPMNMLYPDYIVRFVRKDAIYWPPFVHATPELSYGQRIDIDKNRKELAIIHAYTGSASDIIQTINRYTDLEIKKYNLNDKKFNFCFILWKSFWLVLEKFFIKGGYKDGKRGAIISIMAGFYKFTTYVKIMEKRGELNDKKD